MTLLRKKRAPYSVQPPLTSLIDIVFLLLVYFLLTTSFIEEEGIDIRLPGARAAAPRVAREITVMVDPAGTPYVEGVKVGTDQLFSRLSRILAQDKGQLVVIRADRSVVLDKVVQVMDIAKAAGAGRLCLATEKGI